MDTMDYDQYIINLFLQQSYIKRNEAVFMIIMVPMEFIKV